MLMCDAPPFVLISFGDLAITTNSLPALLAVPIYLAVCGGLCLRRRTLSWIDPILVLGLVAAQLFMLRTSAVANDASGLPGYVLLAPFMIFLAGYAGWRLSGRKPLATWPWPRFGLLVTLTLLLSDIGVALLTPVAAGKVWQLGGACMRDALFIGPPFLMVVFYGLLDCHSSWVFCSKKCVNLGRCRFGMDGKGCDCLEQPAASKEQGKHPREAEFPGE